MENQQNPQTTTHLWTGRNGKKTPLQLMDDEYLRNAYRRCVEASYGNGKEVGISEFHEDTPITKELAALWIPRFQQEAKRRTLTLPKVDRQTYHLDLYRRRQKRDRKQDSNKNFDEKF